VSPTRKIFAFLFAFLLVGTVLTATGGYFFARRVIRAVRTAFSSSTPTSQDFHQWYRGIFQVDVPEGMQLDSGHVVTQVVPPLGTIFLEGVWAPKGFPPWKGLWNPSSADAVKPLFDYGKWAMPSSASTEYFEGEQGIYHCAAAVDMATGRFVLVAAESWN